MSEFVAAGLADLGPDAEAGREERGVRAGTILAGTYRVLERLGAGGMGEVYAVEHLRIGRCFAAKVLRGELAGDPGTMQRFARETRAVAQLRSEHVVSVVDSGTTGEGVPFLVMERLYGHNVRQVLEREGALTAPRAVVLCTDACLGLRVAHAVGLVHRDLKPANLFVTRRDSGEELCKVLDFGIARLEGGDPTERGVLLGTVRYMAPEQLREGGTVNRRTDIYALGTILYECLAGHPPHRGDGLERILYAIMNERPRPLAELGVELPPELDAVVSKALETDPGKRFASADEFIEALSPFTSRWGRAASRARGDDITTDLCEERSKFPRAAPRRIALLAGFGGMLLATAGVAWQARAPRPELTAVRQPVVPVAATVQPNAAYRPGVPPAAHEASLPVGEPARTAVGETKANGVSGVLPPEKRRARSDAASVRHAESVEKSSNRPPSPFSLFDTESPYADRGGGGD